MGKAENSIQLAVLKYLKSKGVYCWRNANVTPQRNGKYLYNPSNQVGLGDIIGVIPASGKHLEVEIKTPTGRMSTVQAIHEKRLNDEGAVYVLVRSKEEIEKWYEEHIDH